MTIRVIRVLKTPPKHPPKRIPQLPPFLQSSPCEIIRVIGSEFVGEFVIAF
jgi:hypothetical protein